jgi:hypothetical protein
MIEKNAILNGEKIEKFFEDREASNFVCLPSLTCQKIVCCKETRHYYIVFSSFFPL